MLVTCGVGRINPASRRAWCGRRGSLGPQGVRTRNRGCETYLAVEGRLVWELAGLKIRPGSSLWDCGLRGGRSWKHRAGSGWVRGLIAGHPRVPSKRPNGRALVSPGRGQAEPWQKLSARG